MPRTPDEIRKDLTDARAQSVALHKEALAIEKRLVEIRIEEKALSGLWGSSGKIEALSQELAQAEADIRDADLPRVRSVYGYQMILLGVTPQKVRVRHGARGERLIVKGNVHPDDMHIVNAWKASK